MGTSFVEYRGRGFWSWDGYLEHLLFLLAEAIGPSPQESWLNEVRDHWREQASGVFTAWIHPDLDEYVTSEDRRDVILKLIDAVQSRPDVTPEAAATAEFMKHLILEEITTERCQPLRLYGQWRAPIRMVGSQKCGNGEALILRGAPTITRLELTRA